MSRIELNLRQAKEIVDLFGDDDETVLVLQNGDDTCHSGRGLYAGHPDYPEEGSHFLGKAE